MKSLAWDTDFFGIRIGRAVLPGEPVRVALEAARVEGIECLYVVAPADRLDLVNDATAHGARLVDLRMELDAETEAWPAPRVETRLATEADRGLVRALARELSAASRFRADDRFPAERIEAMYEVWADACLDSGAVAVAPDGTAFVAARADGGETRLELVYVGPDSSGRGLGGALATAVLRELGARRAHVVTQAANVPALRLYQRLGFRTRSVAATMHVWLDEVR